MFGPESIGKHITQLVANWVFPRESVFGPESIGKHITQLIANWVFPSETEYIAGGLLRKTTYPGTATPTQLQMYATDLRGEPRFCWGKVGVPDFTELLTRSGVGHPCIRISGPGPLLPFKVPTMNHTITSSISSSIIIVFIIVIIV